MTRVREKTAPLTAYRVPSRAEGQSDEAYAMALVRLASATGGYVKVPGRDPVTRDLNPCGWGVVLVEVDDNPRALLVRCQPGDWIVVTPTGSRRYFDHEFRAAFDVVED